MYCICHHLAPGATLGCTTLAIKCTAEAMLYFRSPTWVHCISYHVNQEPHFVYCIWQQVYCICHHVHVHQEPHLGVLYLPTGALYLPFTIKCTAEAIMYIRSLTWVYCICHQVYCICHHLTSGATLGCTTLAIKCTVEAMLYCRSPTWCTAFAIKCTAYAII